MMLDALPKAAVSTPSTYQRNLDGLVGTPVEIKYPSLRTKEAESTFNVVVPSIQYPKFPVIGPGLGRST